MICKNDMQGHVREILYTVALFIVFMLLYAADMFHFSLCGDELKETMEDVPDIYVAQRRWGIAIWKAVFGYGYLPYWHVVFFSLVSSITVLLQIRILGWQTLRAWILYGLAYCACPVWLNLIQISHLSDVFALSMLLSTLAVYFIVMTRGWMRWGYAVMMMIFAMSIYQTSVFYFACLWLAWFICAALRNESVSIIRSGVQAALVLAVGSFISFGISCVLKRTGFASLEVMQMVTAYQSAFSGTWKEMLNQGGWAGLLESLLPVLVDGGLYAVGVNKLIGVSTAYVHLYYTCGALLCLMMGCAILFKSGKRWVALLLALLLLLPYSTYVISGGTMKELRMYMCTGVVTAVMWALTAEYAGSNRKYRCALTILLVFVLMKAAYTFALNSRDRSWYFDRTRIQFHEIYYQARQMAVQSGLTEYKVLWVGDTWSSRGASVAKALNLTDPPFLTGIVQPFAVEHFAAYFGCGKMEWVWKMPEPLEQHVEHMPVWPQQGSMQVYEGNIIVKVYEEEEPH